MSEAASRIVLLFSDDTCLLNGARYRDVPLLVTAAGLPIEPPSGWFRHLAKMGKRRKGLRQTAYNLLTFLRWLESPTKMNERGGVVKAGAISWKHVTDDTLLEYRSHCQIKGNQDNTVNHKLSVVYRFYWWAQEHGYATNRIGNGTTLEGERYPIQIRRFQVRGRWGISSDILLACHEGEILPIPTNKEIDDAFVRLAGNPDYGIRVRNVLMFNWTLTTGIRRAELVQLTQRQLPGLHAMPREDGLWGIQVTGKGGKVRTVYATDDLVRETRSYIDNERKGVITQHSALSGPAEIFLSHRSGEPISERQTNRIFKDAFVDAAARLHTHRVRAKFATDFVNENVDAEVERVGIRHVQIELVLDSLAQVLGHADKRTLRRYVMSRLRWHALRLGKLDGAKSSK